MPSFQLPYSLDKRYLTGIDWVINILDSMTRKQAGHGNSSQIVLVLNGQPDSRRLKSLLKAVLAAYPVLTGKVSRDWNLCPYWKPGLPDHNDIPLSVQELPEGDFDAAFDLLKNHLQQPFRRPVDHLHFQLVNYGEGRALLGMHFDHRLLDAYGAELFLEMLARSEAASGSDIDARIGLTEPAHLDQWIRRFRGGRNVNRLQVRLSRGGLAALPVPKAPEPRKTHIELVTFPVDRTRQIMEAATRESGPLMMLPALLARVLQALHRVVRKQGEAEGHYVIPVSINQRRPGETWQRLFFNHLSFLWFQIPVETVEKKLGLTAVIRDQLYEQLKDGVPDDIYHASMLTRIAPLRVMRRCAKIPMKGRVATSYFACLKESGFKAGSFLGAEVENLVHTPHVPVYPGIGFFINFHADRMNLVFSHVDGILDEKEAGNLISDLKKKLWNMQ